jgi:hypothetical protein
MAAEAAEDEKKCFTNDCQNQATHRVHWPSNVIDVCLLCGAKWCKIADALGMRLHTERLDVAALARTLMEPDQ